MIGDRYDGDRHSSLLVSLNTLEAFILDRMTSIYAHAKLRTASHIHMMLGIVRNFQLGCIEMKKYLILYSRVCCCSILNKVSQVLSLLRSHFAKGNLCQYVMLFLMMEAEEESTSPTLSKWSNQQLKDDTRWNQAKNRVS